MNKLLKYGAAAGALASFAPLAARAQDSFSDLQANAVYNQTDVTTAGAITGAALIFLLVLAVLGLALFIFWIFMLVDIFKRNNWKQENDKVIWIVVVILFGYLGAIIYYFVVKRSLDKQPKGPENMPPSQTPQAPPSQK
jgi:hypothetical protein